MAHFRAVIKGQRGEASRLGSKVSGLHVTADGWNSGVNINASVHEIDGDVFDIYATGGSNARGGYYHIGSVRNGLFVPSDKVRENCVAEYKAGRYVIEDCEKASHTCWGKPECMTVVFGDAQMCADCIEYYAARVE